MYSCNLLNRLNVRLTDTQLKKLEKIAKANHLTVSELIRSIITSYLLNK